MSQSVRDSEVPSSSLRWHCGYHDVQPQMLHLQPRFLQVTVTEAVWQDPMTCVTSCGQQLENLELVCSAWADLQYLFQCQEVGRFLDLAASAPRGLDQQAAHGGMAVAHNKGDSWRSRGGCDGPSLAPQSLPTVSGIFGAHGQGDPSGIENSFHMLAPAESSSDIENKRPRAQGRLC